jgi:hypothetical protein
MKTKSNNMKNGGMSKSKSSDNPHRKLPGKGNKLEHGKGGGKVRDKATIERIKMYRGGRAIRDKNGKVIGGELMMRDTAGGTKIDGSTGRVQPDRRWFGNTRTIAPGELDKFRETMRTAASNPLSVVLRRRKLPMGLLVDGTKATNASATATAAALSDGAIGGAPELERLKSVELLSAEPFEGVFAKGRPRKRPRLLEQVRWWFSRASPPVCLASRSDWAGGVIRKCVCAANVARSTRSRTSSRARPPPATTTPSRTGWRSRPRRPTATTTRPTRRRRSRRAARVGAAPTRPR